MGSNLPLNIIGAGGGGKSGGGGGLSEAPDTLSSVALARFVDLIGEGQISGLVNGEYSIYLDGVPLRSTEGTANYKPFRWDYRSGTQTQTPIPGFAGTQSETAVGLKILKTQGRVVRSVPDAGAESVRLTLSVSGLSTTTTDGKINGASVAYRVWMRAVAGNWLKVYDGTIDGKTMSKYQRSIEIPTWNLGVGPYEVGVERLTDDSGSTLLVNDLYWDSFTIINSEQFSYPNSVLVALELDARYFSQIPTRSYHVRGLLVRVPTNYYPDGVPTPYTFSTVNPRYATSGPGTTNGAWDGTFKISYSNNPAWCYYDLLLNRRYGLGRRISAAQVDKWTVYSIGQYCDQLVATGLTANISDLFGSAAVNATGKILSGVPSRQSNMEPRFTLNCVINTREDAYRVLGQLTSVFRGMAYWGGGQVALVQDRFTKPSIIYTNANVIDGKFNYQGSSRSGRHTTCTVGWNDPSEDFKQKFEYVEDRDGIARYGIVPTDIVAFGCTSRAQARRVGLWLLYTERMESDMVAFKVGLDSSFIRPGMTALLHDSNRAGIRWGGRVISATLAMVTLDSSVTLTAGGYTLSVMAQDGTVTTKTVTVTAGTYSTLTPSTAFAVAPAAMALWTLASATVTPMQVRILSIAEDGPTAYSVTAVENNPTKYAAIDAGVPITLQNYSVLSVTSVPGLTGLQAKENSFKALGSFDVQSHIEVSWDRLNDPMVRGYVVTCWGNVQKQIVVPETKDASVTLRGVVPDTYTVTVHAVNHLGISGPNVAISVAVTGVDSIGPSPVTTFSAQEGVGGVALSWTPCTDPDYAETEIRVGPTFATATRAFVGSTSAWLWPWPAAGTYVVWAVHRDSSNNLGTPVSAAATVAATGLVQWSTIGGIPTDAIYNSRVGQSGNLLANTTFGATTVAPWAYGHTANIPNYFGTELQRDPTQPLCPLGMDAIVMRQLGVLPGGNAVMFSDFVSESINVVPSQRYEASVYSASHRCDVVLHIQWYNSLGVGFAADGPVTMAIKDGGQALALFNRLVLFGVAPAQAVSCRILYRKLNTYTGQADSYAWLLAPYLGVAGADQTAPTPYSPSTSVSLERAAIAKTAADNAASSAALALVRYENIASDNVLSRVEKSGVIQDWNTLDGEYPSLDAQAALFGITTERAAYTSSKGSLSVYLVGITPSYADVSADSAISGATFRSMWNSTYLARSTLLNAISAKAKTLADSAQNTANSAASSAALALARYENIASDNVLSRVEKSGVIQDWDTLYGEFPALDAQAALFGITTERTAYANAKSALSSYLLTLSPGYSDVSADSTIVGTTFRSMWGSAYLARSTLINAISAKAKTLADAAQGSANNALAQLQAIASDGVLSRGEKAQVILDWYELYNNQGGVAVTADGLGIVDELNAYNTAINVLAQYLISLSPGWADTSQDTTIVPAVWRGNWDTAYQKRQLLLNRIAVVSSQRADGLGQASNIINCQTEFANHSMVGWDIGSWITNRPFAYSGSELARDSAGNYVPAGGNAIVLVQGVPATTADTYVWGSAYGGGDNTFGVAYTRNLVPCEPGKRYCVSAFVAAHRCTADIYLEFHKADGSNTSGGGYMSCPGASGGRVLSGWQRLYVFGVAPADAAGVRILFAKRNTTTGYQDSYAWMTQPMIERAGSLQLVPSSYSPSAATSHAQLGDVVTSDLAANAATEVLQVTFAGPISFTSTMGL